jgi:hemerythrin
MERVYEAVLDRRSPDVIALLLNSLVRLCAEHFATEERVLRRYGYSHADARAAMHTLLLERIPDLQTCVPAGGNGMAPVVEFLHSLCEEAGYGSGAYPGRSRSNGSGGVLLVSY